VTPTPTATPTATATPVPTVEPLPQPNAPTGSPVNKYGAIRVGDSGDIRTLLDEAGNPLQLKGMSTFGLQWGDGEWILTDSAFDSLADYMGVDVVRLAMYVSETGYADHPAELLEKIEKGIQLGSERGLYVIVDWHMLNPGDPTNPIYLDAGKDLPEYASIRAEHPEYSGPQLFFAYLSRKYGQWSNLIFEDANEPNGLGGEDEAADVWKEKLLPYHQAVVDTIRAYDSDGTDNIILCGSDNWSQFVDSAVDNPVQDENGQIMYSVHFYTGTHDVSEDDPETPEDESNWLKGKITNAVNGGLAVFASEWGTSEASGDHGPYIDNAEVWLKFLEDNNISWCNWSLARKLESSSATLPTTPNDQIWTDDDLTVSGRYVRAKIRGEEIPIYEGVTAVVYDFSEGVGIPVLNDGNVNSGIVIAADSINGSEAARISGVNTYGVWDNRIQFSSVKYLYGIYQNLSFDVYLSRSALDVTGQSDTVFSVKPVFQYAINGGSEMNWWNDAIPEVGLSGDEFSSVEGTDLVKATVVMPISPLSPQPKDTLEHLILLVSLGGLSEGADIYLDNLAFTSDANNGDIKYQPAIPDEPGTFIKLPFDFESGQREGWAKEGTSAVENTQISIAEAETQALMFPVSFNTANNEWEDGARLSSTINLSYEDSVDVKSVSLDLFIEQGKMTTGELTLNVCPIPNGDGYWYQAGSYSFDESVGTPFTTAGGVALVKYQISVPLSEDGSYPFTVGIRNLVLALQSSGSDYVGNIYYDNINLDK
ncbi:MAG: glycoside hydrolase family 5 protein, partial [Clostridiales bacterium]|nr:glycoside hydrolase family 5 protein [Clostridiales bacterium]